MRGELNMKITGERNLIIIMELENQEEISNILNELESINQDSKFLDKLYDILLRT